MPRTYLEETIFRFAYKEELAYKPVHTKPTEFRKTDRDLTYYQKKRNVNHSAVYVWSTELKKGLVARNNSILPYLAILCG